MDRIPKSAATQAELRAYFKKYYDGSAWRCGARRRRCSRCGFRYQAAEQMLLECPQCGTSRRCRRRVGAGASRCTSHERGHLRVPGVLHPAAYHKAFARSGKDLASRYAEVYKAIEMRSVKQEAALLQTRAQQVAEQLTVNQSTAAWLRMRAAVSQIDALQAKVAAGDKAAQRVYGSLVAGIFADIRSGAQEAGMWSEAMVLAERVANMKAREAAIERDRKAYLTAAEAVALTSSLAFATLEVFADLRSAIESHHQQLVDAVPNLAERIKANPDGAAGIAAEWLAENSPAKVLKAFGPAKQKVIARVATATGQSSELLAGEG